MWRGVKRTTTQVGCPNHKAKAQNKRPGQMPGPFYPSGGWIPRGEETWNPSSSARPDERAASAYAAFANFSTATVTRAVIGASVCSVSLNDASVSLPDSASDFSNAARAKLDCNSNASLSDFTPVSALNADMLSSSDACAAAAKCLDRSCIPVAQIWL